MSSATHKALLAGLLAMAGLTSIAVAADRDRGRGSEGRDRGAYQLDNRYNHGHYYPRPGVAFRSLPSARLDIRYRDTPYVFHGGVWYRPRGPGYVVVRPPLGIGIAVLPPFYSTIWFGGIPYYYADDTYYVWQPDRHEYVVTAPPADAPSSTTNPAANQDLFVYPAHGQSEQQQATDRFECYQWAKQQTGFDPTQPQGGTSGNDVASHRADYQRAERTCLEGRGYTVN